MILSFKKQQQYSTSLLFLFSILILSIIPVYRTLFYNGLPPGETVYSHMYLGNYILEQGVPSLDPTVALSRPYFFDLFDLLLGIFGSIIGMNLAALALPFLLGLVTLFFCYRLFILVFSPMSLWFPAVHPVETKNAFPGIFRQKRRL